VASAAGGAGSSADLSARLLTADSVPPGFIVEAAAAVTVSDAGDERPGADESCSESTIPLLSARRLTGTPSAMAGATLSYAGDPGGFWVGIEVLRTYADDSARRAMSDLRTIIRRCPTVVLTSGFAAGNRYRFAVAPGPRIGDDSMHARCSMTYGSKTLRCDSLLVRIGTTLVVIHEEGNGPGGDRYLAPLAEAAIRRYAVTGS